MCKLTLTIKRVACLLFAVVAVSVTAASFEDLSKSFVVLQSSSGKEYLCAAVKMNGASYVVTSQSLFMNPILKFSIRSFAGKRLKQIGFDAARTGDFVRIKFEDSAEVSLLDIAGNDKWSPKVYAMNPDTGIVYQSGAGKSNLNTKSFACNAGAPVIDENGNFSGVSSRTDDGLGKEVSIKWIPLQKDEKWVAMKSGLFAKQVYSLEKLRSFTKALNHTMKNSAISKYIEINVDTHPKLFSWLKNQNMKSREAKLSRSKKYAMGSGVTDHKNRCSYYSSLKRMAGFYSSNAITAKRAKWTSSYLKENAEIIFKENTQSANILRDQMKSMVKLHPSISSK